MAPKGGARRKTASRPSRASPLPHLTEFHLWNAVECGSGLAREGAGPGATDSGLDEMLAVMLQLSNRLANIIQRQMRAAFMEAVFDFRRPACGQLFERRHIQVAVVEVAFQRFHVRIKEATILADAVAADRRLALGHPFFKEGDGFSFGVAHADAAVTHE